MTYLISEDFDGSNLCDTGHESVCNMAAGTWVAEDSAGTIDFDDDTTIVSGHCCKITANSSNDAGLRSDMALGSPIWAYFAFEIGTLDIHAYSASSIIAFEDNAENIQATFGIGAPATDHVYQWQTSSKGTEGYSGSSVSAAGNIYHVWVKYDVVAGTITAWVSTTSTRPTITSPTCTADGAAGAAIAVVSWEAWNLTGQVSSPLYLDKIRISRTELKDSGAEITAPTLDTTLRFTGSTDDLTREYTVGTGATLLCLGIVTGGAASVTPREAAAPTFNGTAMTQVGTTQTPATNPEVSVELWYLLNPTEGAHNIIVPNSGTAAIYCTASSYIPTSGYTLAYDTYAENKHNGLADPSVSITPSGNGAVIVGVLGDGRDTAPTKTGTLGNAINLTDNGAFSDSNQYYLQETAAAWDCKWTVASDDWGMVVGSFIQSAAGTQYNQSLTSATTAMAAAFVKTGKKVLSASRSFISQRKTQWETLTQNLITWVRSMRVSSARMERIKTTGNFLARRTTV